MSFKGLQVEIKLKHGLKLEGIVENVDEETHQMDLINVKMIVYGMEQQLDRYKINGKDVENLSVKEPKKAKVPRPPKQRKERSKSFIRYNNSDTFGPDSKQITEDFDFQESLLQFDKKRVFDEIKKLDQTRPQDRLVYSNLRRQQQKIPHNVNVLDLTEETATTDFDMEESEAPLAAPPEVVFSTNSGIHVPLTSRQQVSQIESAVVSDAGIGWPVLLENGGRGIAMMVLQIISARLLEGKQHKIVVLAGCNRVGAYALVCARHLLNHDCHVSVCIPQNTADKVLEKQVSYLTAIGCTFLTLDKLEKPDLIVDGILGTNPSIHMLESQMIAWAANIAAPVLSIDLPSGCHPISGHASQQHLKAKWTCAMGLLKSAYLECPAMGSIFLCDIGLPPAIVKRFIKYKMPFEDKFLVLIKKHIQD